MATIPTIPTRAATSSRRQASDNRLMSWQFALVMLTICMVGTYLGRLVLLRSSSTVYVPELYLLPLGAGMMLFRTKGLTSWTAALFQQRLLVALMLGATLSAVMGVLLGGEPKANYAHYRIIIAFACSYHYFRSRSRITDRSALLLIAVGLIAYAIYLQYHGTNTTNDDQAEKNRFPLIANLIGVFIAIRYDRKVFGVLIGGLSIYLSVVSNYRVDLALSVLWMLIFVFCALFGVGANTPQSRKSRTAFVFLRIVLFVAVIAGVSTFAPTVSLVGQFFSDDARYSQLITKSELVWNVVTGSGQASDESSLGTRIHIINIIIDNWPSLILPIGLGPFDAIHRIYNGNDISTLDSGIGFAAIHFGIIFSLVLAYCAYKDFGRMVSFRRPLDLMLAVSLLIYFLVTGEALGMFELAVMSGACLGIYRRSLYPGGPLAATSR